MTGVDPRDIQEGDPIWIRFNEYGTHYQSGHAHWEDGALYAQDGGIRIPVTPDVDIVGWIPQLDFGDTA